MQAAHMSVATAETEEQAASLILKVHDLQTLGFRYHQLTCKLQISPSLQLHKLMRKPSTQSYMTRNISKIGALHTGGCSSGPVRDSRCCFVPGLLKFGGAAWQAFCIPAWAPSSAQRADNTIRFMITLLLNGYDNSHVITNYHSEFRPILVESTDI